MNIAAGKAQTLVYTRVVADARRGLTVGEIGGVTRFERAGGSELGRRQEQTGGWIAGAPSRA